MRTEQLQHFLEIAKCQSLTQAAENLFIGKSTLSNSISSLENELQNDLFWRTTKGTFLTPFGENMVPLAEKVIRANQEIFRLAQAKSTTDQKSLYVYSYPVGSVSAMVRLLEYMNASYPETNLTIPETQTENIINDLISTGHSIGVVASGNITYPYIKRKAENHDFAFEPVFEDSLYVFVHKSNPLCHYSTIHLDQLINKRVIIYRLFVLPDKNTFYHDFRKLNHLYTVDNYELLKKLITSAQIVGIAPGLTFQENKRKDIVKIPIEDSTIKLTISLVFRKDPEKMSHVEFAAIKFLRDYYKHLEH